MAALLDHIILNVNDAKATAEFLERVLGFSCEGQQGPFTVVRINESATLQLAPWGTKGGEHLAFALSRAEFDAAFARIRESNIDWGDSFHTVGNRKDPGEEVGARGMGKSIYFFDPNKHLLEIRHYDV
jgi:catechol 2,3-dioxygenase-like lactoylglutathione lyase family enzyme